MSSYALAIAALQEIRPPRSAAEFEKLSLLMVRAGNRAAEWNPKTDLYDSQRQADEEFLTSGVPSLLNKIVLLQDLSEKHSRGFDAMAWRAAHSIGLTPDLMRAAGYDHGAGGQAGRLIKALLEALRSQIEAETRTENGPYGSHAAAYFAQPPPIPSFGNTVMRRTIAGPYSRRNFSLGVNEQFYFYGPRRLAIWAGRIRNRQLLHEGRFDNERSVFSPALKRLAGALDRPSKINHCFSFNFTSPLNAGFGECRGLL
jgi:hypothetical protein